MSEYITSALTPKPPGFDGWCDYPDDASPEYIAGLMEWATAEIAYRFAAIGHEIDGEVEFWSNRHVFDDHLEVLHSRAYGKPLSH